MQNWEYTFEATSKAGWLKQITQDLKGKNVEELYREWWPGEPLIPIHHQDDQSKPIRLPDFLFTNPPTIIEEFDGEYLTSQGLNEALKTCLAYGTQQIIFHPGNYSASTVEQILDGIFPEMVTWHIRTENEFHPLLVTLMARAPETTFLRLLRTPGSNDLKHVLGNLAISPSSVKLNYSFTGAGNWVKECIQNFKIFRADMEACKAMGIEVGLFLDSCVMTYIPDAHYFKQIIQCRTLHLIWQNLYESVSGSNTERSDYLETHIYPGSTENPDTYLIHASSSALAANMSGSTNLCIHPLTSPALPEFYHRIDRNINHLLFLESGLPSKKDPMAGSYPLDFYTRLWTEQIWKALEEE